jgi:hypothetical protein
MQTKKHYASCVPCCVILCRCVMRAPEPPFVGHEDIVLSFPSPVTVCQSEAIPRYSTPSGAEGVGPLGAATNVGAVQGMVRARP